MLMDEMEEDDEMTGWRTVTSEDDAGRRSDVELPADLNLN